MVPRFSALTYSSTFTVRAEVKKWSEHSVVAAGRRAGARGRREGRVRSCMCVVLPSSLYKRDSCCCLPNTKPWPFFGSMSTLFTKTMSTCGSSCKVRQPWAFPGTFNGGYTSSWQRMRNDDPHRCDNVHEPCEHVSSSRRCCKLLPVLLVLWFMCCVCRRHRR